MYLGMDFGPGWPPIGCRQIDRDGERLRRVIPGRGGRVPGPRSQIEVQRTQAPHQLSFFGPAGTRLVAGHWGYLLSVAFVGFLFSFMLFKCFIKIAYGNGGRGQAAVSRGRRQGDLCQRHHRGTHSQQQQKKYLF